MYKFLKYIFPDISHKDRRSFLLTVNNLWNLANFDKIKENAIAI